MPRSTFSGHAVPRPTLSVTKLLSELLGLSGVIATLAVWGVLAQGLGL